MAGATLRYKSARSPPALHPLRHLIDSTLLWNHHLPAAPSDNPPTVAPQSVLLHKPHYELNTPALKDVSKCSSDETWGEAAVERYDASPDFVRSDREESVSDASQYVTGGCAVRYHFFSSLRPPSPQGSTISESINASSSSQLAPFTPSPQSSDAGSSPPIVAPQAQFLAVHGISTSRKISEGIWLYMILKHLDTNVLCPIVAHDETP
ncbi:hypothetical protein BDZ45DRAFT_742370 [Acephala macrosclerotiorum]|nr:hypothetical protein BDZ45DRAFT_742370 [Acephala macrosclerotiorum]